MDGQDLSHRHVDANRPALGFPLGTVLLIFSIFLLSSIFSCCYQWDKIRALRRASTDTNIGTDALRSPPKSTNTKENARSMLPVIMPGDSRPKYIAWPCSCQPSPQVPEKKSILVMDIPSLSL